MLSGNGTSGYSVEARNLDPHKVYAVCKMSITRYLHGGSTHNFHKFTRAQIAFGLHSLMFFFILVTYQGECVVYFVEQKIK